MAAAAATATNQFPDEEVRIPTKEEYIEMVTVDMKTYLIELNLDQPRSASTNPPANPLGLNQSGVSTIFRVGPDVRHRDTISAYDPQIISIGPYHSYKKDLRVFQELKWIYLKKLLDRSPNHNNSLETYIKAIGNCEKQARECYSDEVPDRNFCELVDILVLDGCFILEILLEHSHPEGIKGPITAAKWNLRQLYHDLLLLENQIPFFVLERIFENTTVTPATGKPQQPLLSLMDLALHYIMSRGDVFKSGGDHVVKFNNNHPKIYHLLHLSYHSVLQGLIDDFKPQPSTSPVTDVLLGLRKLIVPCSPFSEKKRDTSRFPRSIPTATELQKVGVHFLTKKGATSYINVSFMNRKMEMASLYMQPEYFSDFYNLLAFEQGCFAMDNKFTSYVVFMNNIVNTVEDVSLLRTSGILEFARCNDSDVAELFNNLGSTAYLDFENHYLGQLFKDVIEYYEQDKHKWRRTMTRLLYGAGLIILLTVISTVFTVISYFKS